MANFLYYSQYGNSLPLALDHVKHGHKVWMYIEDHECRLMGKDMGIEKTYNFFEVVDQFRQNKQELQIWFDDIGYGDLADHLKGDGFPVGGAAKMADKLEDERTLADETFKKAIDFPPTKEFTSFAEAKGFVQAQGNDIRFVFKPNGSDTPKDWTYVAKSKDDLLNQMEYYRQEWDATQPVAFQLQEFIEGDECDFGGYFNWQKGWLRNSFQWYYENKKLLTGNLGPATGCAEAMQYFTTDQEPYFKMHLSKMTDILKQAKYSGAFTVNNIFSYKYNKFFFLEDTFRFGYDDAQNQFHILNSYGKDPAELLISCTTGKSLPDNYFPINKFGFDVRFYVPPYPVKGKEEDAHSAKGHVVRYDKSVENNIYWDDVYWDEKQKLLKCAGSSGSIGTMNTCKDNPDEAINDMYTNLLPKLNIANVGYRTDSGKRVKDTIKRLVSVGAALNPLDK